jgi:glycosyltransferase involved in cell wall biosynthesis
VLPSSSGRPLGLQPRPANCFHSPCPPFPQDKILQFKYGPETVEAGKAYAKAALQREAGLPVDPRAPLFGFIGRLEEQKGVDILLAALKKLPAGLNAQVRRPAAPRRAVPPRPACLPCAVLLGAGCAFSEALCPPCLACRPPLRLQLGD